MDFEKILSALISGEISPAEAEKQRIKFLQQKTNKRGRPKKNSVVQQKYRHSGRPKSLDAVYKAFAVNGLWIVLNYLAKDMPKMKKRDFIAARLNTSRPTVDRAITKLNRDIQSDKTIYLYNPYDGMVFICNGTENVQRFVSNAFLEKQSKLSNRLKIK